MSIITMRIVGYFPQTLRNFGVVRTNFSADFETFRNFWPQFRENCGAT